MINRPTKILTEMSKKLPDYAWLYYASLLQEHKKGTPGYAWPAWCFCPISGALGVLSRGADTLSPEQRERLVPSPGVLAAIAAWRPTRGCYRFAKEVYDALISTPIDKIPTELIYRLPEWCVYIETPGGTKEDADLLGFFAYLEYDAPSGGHELRFVLDRGGDRLLPSSIPLTGCETLKECIEVGYDDTIQYASSGNSGAALFRTAGKDTVVSVQIARFTPLVSLLLYLCSEEPDIHPLQAPGGGKPTKPAQVLTVTKKQPAGAFFQAVKETVWEVGASVQAAMQKARQATSSFSGGGGSMKSPHIRKAHWTHYWTGPKTGQQIAIARWIPPLAINSDLADPAMPGTDEEPVVKKF